MLLNWEISLDGLIPCLECLEINVLDMRVYVRILRKTYVTCRLVQWTFLALPSAMVSIGRAGRVIVSVHLSPMKLCTVLVPNV